MRTRMAVALVAVLVTGFVTGALAQPRPKPARPAAKPKPSAVADGGTDNPYSSEAPAGSAAPTASAATAPADVGPPRVDTSDGGLKLSPLNPAANEFPDGGAPAETIDYDKLLADIASLRARVAAVS